MFGKKDREVDAIEELEREESEQGTVEGGYGRSGLGSQRRQSPPGTRLFILVILCLILAVGGAFTYKAMSLRSEKAEEKPKDSVSKVIPAITPRALPEEPEPVVHPVQVTQTNSGAAQDTRSDYSNSRTQEKSPAQLARERMLKSSLGGSSAGSDSSAANGDGEVTGQLVSSGNGNGSGGGELADKLQPMNLSGSRAGIIRNQDMVITQGTMLDCVLNTRMITTQPGMTKCTLTRDVYSTNGRVVLLDRGSEVTGFYQGGMTQGQARIFVNWTRAKTPKGVIIDVSSPGTGPLGEAGVGGWMDTHFFERFGGALMISLIGDLGDWASRQGSSQGDGSIQFSNTANGAEQAATEALRNSINIPPTLYKNQGERVSIFVARDLDFSSVYSLKAN
ncbi:type IV secretion system protein VirB10 [Salmonella enterica]